MATLWYGKSFDDGYVSVTKNGVEIDLRKTRGDSEVTFEYNALDVLKITEIDNTVINIHSLLKNPNAGMIDIFDNII